MSVHVNIVPYQLTLFDIFKKGDPSAFFGSGGGWGAAYEQG